MEIQEGEVGYKMDLSKQNIMFLLRATQHGGTENVVIQLCEILKPYVNKIVICSAAGFNRDLLNGLGIQHFEIPDIEEKSPKIILNVLRKISFIIKKEHISIIHTHHRMAAFYAYILLHKYKFIFINTSHNTFTDKRFLTCMIYKKANLVTCGEMVKKNLVNYYKLPKKSITVIHNAVRAYDGDTSPIEVFDYLKKEGYSLIGNIGRLSKQKGMEYFIKSLPLVLKKNPNVMYIIIGDGEEKEKLVSLTKKVHVEDRIIFMGYRNDIRNVITQLDLVVLSSLWEGLPLIPIEAFSVGKTVVGTAVDGTIEVIQNGINGFLVPSKSPEAIADKVNYFMENREMLVEFGANAKKRFEAEFSFEKFANSFINYYERL